MTSSSSNRSGAVIARLLGGFAVLACPFSVAAQSGLGAIVCVGSEVRPLDSSNPVQRVVREDVAVAYRVGVPLDERETVERSLLSELGGHARASCVWSGPGDAHVAVIQYTGAIRRDLTLDPDDPRFQAFAVGFGTSAEAAESSATTIDARFATNYDGSGYEVVVAESWTADAVGVAAGTTAGAVPGEVPPAPAAPGGPRGTTAPAPGTEFSDCDVCPRMVVVPAGTFMMGSPASEDGRRYDDEGPQHLVTIPAPFAVGVHEVTFAEWDACVIAGGCGRSAADDEGWGRGSRPVIHVSWDDAQTYVTWLSRQTGARYRLLSEAEWEYAARAGSTTARYWGESDADQCRYANGNDHRVSCSDGHDYTAPAGSFLPNEFGLYDMLGNVLEWTQDCVNVTLGYAGAPADGSAWQSGPCYRRVARGGAWDSFSGGLRSASRANPFSDMRFWHVGFRVARTLN